MDPLDNPYRPSAGSRPLELAGRDEQLEAFRIMAGRVRRGHPEQSIIATGLRGVGKTVLLNTFEDLAEKEGFLGYYHELAPGTDLVESLARDVEQALGALKLTERLATKLHEGLGHLKTIRFTGPADFGLAVDLRDANENTLAADLTDLFLEVGAVAQERERAVIFFLDELQFVDEMQYRALISALHRANQKALPICAAGAGLPQIPRLTGESRSYAERLFTFPHIDSLDDEAATAALVEPARTQEIAYVDDAVALALEWTAGYPFYIQQLGKHVWNLAEQSPITRKDVENAIPPAQSALDRSVYAVRIQRTTENERRYLRAMAELGDGPYKSGSVANKLGKTTASLSPVRQQLLDKGLIYATEDYGFLDFSVPRFAEYMRRYMPYRAPRRRKSSAASRKPRH